MDSLNGKRVAALAVTRPSRENRGSTVWMITVWMIEERKTIG
jgi:hypothetical protein